MLNGVNFCKKINKIKTYTIIFPLENKKISAN